MPLLCISGNVVKDSREYVRPHFFYFECYRFTAFTFICDVLDITIFNACWTSSIAIARIQKVKPVHLPRPSRGGSRDLCEFCANSSQFLAKKIAQNGFEAFGGVLAAVVYWRRRLS